MTDPFEKRKKQRMKKYGARIIKDDNVITIKKFKDTGDDNFTRLEKLRKIFYPHLTADLKMDRSIVKKYFR